MSRYCVDTTAYSNYRRGHPRLLELLDAAEWIGVPAIVVGELCFGFLQGRRPHENEVELTEFLGHPLVHELAVDRETARLYAEILLSLKRKGTPIPTNDVWIAATAARHGASVLTSDEHFRLIERVGSVVIGPTGS